MESSCLAGIDNTVLVSVLCTNCAPCWCQTTGHVLGYNQDAEHGASSLSHVRSCHDDGSRWKLVHTAASLENGIDTVYNIALYVFLPVPCVMQGSISKGTQNPTACVDRVCKPHCSM